MQNFIDSLKGSASLFVLLAIDGQESILQRGQARLEEAADVSWAFLQENKDVAKVVVLDGEEKVHMEVTRKTDKRTGQIYPSHK